MFWNSEFINASPSPIDELLEMPSTRLADLLFVEDLLQELKTSNVNLAMFLGRPDVVNELVDNITQLTEKDCCEKLLYSRVHAAYISCEILIAGATEIFSQLLDGPESLAKIIASQQDTTTNNKVIPQKATLVAKLINNIHSNAPERLSCHISQDIESLSKLVQISLENIDVSGSFEILSTFVKRTIPPELRYVFCEILSKLNFVFGLIDVMTLSNVEDKQRNACQLLCDIIVIGRQEIEQNKTDTSPIVRDMLAEVLESKEAVHRMLTQMFSQNEDEDSSTRTSAIVCGMKLLQTLVENKQAKIANIEQIQDELEKHLTNFHELLLNPPRQEPIKTTFGVIEKPLGYIRLEVVSLIRALISTNSPKIINKLTELKTMKVIIDLFVDYSWNNLLHTQVEQALCLIIRNCRSDEDQMMSQQESETPTIMSSEIDRTEKPPTPPISTSTTTTTPAPSQQQNNEISDLSLNQNHENPTPLNQNHNCPDQNDDSSPPPPLTQDHNHDGTNSLDQNHETPESLEQNHVTTTLQSPQNHETTAPPSDQNHVTSTPTPTTTLNHNHETATPSNHNHVTTTQPLHNNNEIASNSLDHNHKTTTTTTNQEFPSRALLSQTLDECCLIERLLLPAKNGEQANFGHIIQIINSLAINNDLDAIRDHLNDMKDNRPELFERWTTFVSVDVASFKEISLYYDVHPASNIHIDDRFGGHKQHNQSSAENNGNSNMTMNGMGGNKGININDADDQLIAYFSFTKEAILPTINVDVLPKTRGHPFTCSKRDLR